MEIEDLEELIKYLDGNVKSKNYVELSWTEAEYILNVLLKENKK